MMAGRASGFGPRAGGERARDVWVLARAECSQAIADLVLEARLESALAKG